jgi:hypothetical protein
MKRRLHLVILLLLVWLPMVVIAGSIGIKPEQIFQPTVELHTLFGTWEVLPDDSPLEENTGSGPELRQRTLLTLRKDRTCRLIDREHPTGSDGLWTFEEHAVAISLPNGLRVELFVYGVKGDFMMTRSALKDGTEQLWGRVK